MALIFQTLHFLVEAPENPLIDRNDGGHITISPKTKVTSVQDFNSRQAIELIRLIMVVGEAMTTVMISHGVDIGRINYQDNGNWGVFKPDGPSQHYHIYGRAKSARHQPYGQACYFPHKDEHPEFYAENVSLSAEDIREINVEISRLFNTSKYSDSSWAQFI